MKLLGLRPIPLLLLLGCKHFAETQVASHTDAATAAEVAVHEVKSEGPEHIVMTVEEFSQLCDPVDGGNAGAVTGAPPASNSVAPAVPATGLIRRVTTVTDRGPSLDDLRSLSTLQSKVNTALAVHEEKKSVPVGLFAALLGLWPVVLIGGAVLVGFVVWRAKPPWLSFLFKLLGRAP